MARVSIVIPTYNREQLLQVTLDSVFAQTFTDLEVIVVDDCSTDNTKAMLDMRYPGRVRYIRNEKNMGLVPTCNAGLRAATGEFVNFLDSDDLFEPTKIEKQVAVMDARPDISVVNVRHWHIDQHGNKLDKCGLLPEGETTLRDLVLLRMWWIGSTLFRRNCFDKVGPFDESLIYQDWNIWLRTALAGFKFACVQEHLGSYRLHPVTMSGSASNAELIVPVLHKFWAMPGIPGDIVPLKDESFANMHRYVATLYYHAEQWADGQRHLMLAAERQPQWARDANDVAQAIFAAAQMRRIADPVKFVNDVFDHLPEPLMAAQQHRKRVVAQTHMLAAMRAYTFGGIVTGKSLISQALAGHPNADVARNDFISAVYTGAVGHPTLLPHEFVQQVFDNLPADAELVRGLRREIIGRVAVASAFEEHSLHHPELVRTHVVTALRNRPSLLRNRGVLSIFLRSLVAP